MKKKKKDILDSIAGFITLFGWYMLLIIIANLNNLL